MTTDNGTKPLVYIVDDEPELRELLREALTSEGYEVETLWNGNELLNRVEERHPNLILLDITMPGLSGWVVQKRLTTNEATRDIPVIAVTARGGPSVEASARRTLHFADFVRKPFSLDDLLARVQAALAKAPAGATGATGANPALDPEAPDHASAAG